MSVLVVQISPRARLRANASSSPPSGQVTQEYVYALSPDGLFLQTIYHPLRLYAEHCQGVALDVHVSGETYALRPGQESVSPSPSKLQARWQ